MAVDIPRLAVPNAPQQTGARIAPQQVQQTPGGPGGGIAGAFARAGQQFEAYQNEADRIDAQRQQFALAQAEDGAKADAAKALASAQQKALEAISVAKQNATTIDSNFATNTMNTVVNKIFENATHDLSPGAQDFARARVGELQGSFYAHLLSWQEANNHDITLANMKAASQDTVKNNAENAGMSEYNNATYKASLDAMTTLSAAEKISLFSDHMQRSNEGIVATATEKQPGSLFNMLQSSMSGKLKGDNPLHRAINALDPTAKVTLVNRAHDLMNRDADRVRQSNALAVDNLVAQASVGMPVSEANIPPLATFVAGYGSDSGAFIKANLERRSAVMRVRAASILAAAPSAGTAKTNAAVQSLFPTDPHSPYFATDLEIASKLREAVNAQTLEAQKDPVRAARTQGRGGPAIQNGIDFTQDAVPLAGAIADRAMAASRLPGQDPSSPTIFEQGELPIFEQRLQHMTPVAKANLMDHIRVAMIQRDPITGSLRFGAFATQLHEHNPDMGGLAGLSSLGNTNMIVGSSLFGAPDTMSAQRLARYGWMGQQALNPPPGTNPVPKMDATNEAQFDARWKIIAGHAYDGMPATTVANAYAMAKSIYYGMQVEQHPTDTKTYDPKIAEKAIRGAVGVVFTPPGAGNQFVDLHYSGDIVAPPGMTEAQARDALDEAWIRTRAANPRTAGKYNLSGVSLTTVPGAPGIYQVFRANQPLRGDNGNAVIIDARRPAAQRAPAWRRTVEALGNAPADAQSFGF